MLTNTFLGMPPFAHAGCGPRYDPRRPGAKHGMASVASRARRAGPHTGALGYASIWRRPSLAFSARLEISREDRIGRSK